jgi:acetyltransferase
MNLNYFFKPLGVAIVGASSDKEKIGRQVLDNIIASDYRGKVYPINLKDKKVAGLVAFSGLDKIPTKKFDSILAIIAIPAQFVIAEIEKCGLLGIKNIVIISSGFKETGAEGAAREKELIILAEKYSLNILGPNCLGFINNIFHLNASFAGSGLTGGKIALLSQSGAIGSAVLDWLRDKNFNLGYFISLGNKAVLDENDFLVHLAADKNIGAIILYLEDIKNGCRFMEIASKITPIKPIIVLKAGMSDAGSKIAKSHTGALAGGSMAVKAGLERAGVIMIDSLDELFDLLLLLQAEATHGPITNSLQILTNAGGLAVLSADEIARQHLLLGGSMDIFGDADDIKYEAALNELAKKKSADNILILLTPQTSTKPVETAAAIIRVDKKYPKRLLMASFLGGVSVREAKNLLTQASLPVFDYPERAIRTVKQLSSWKENVNGLTPFRAIPPVSKKIDSDYLSLFESVKKYKIPVVKTIRYGSNVETTYPVVLKAVGPDFLHKTDKGAVMLNLNNRLELEKAAANFYRNNKKVLQDEKNYLVVQPQIKGSLELILGFKRDVSFGPVLLLGLGGIYAEIFKEIKIVIADLDKRRAYKLVKSLPFFPILNGARGGKKYDIDGLVNILVAFSRLAMEHIEIQEFDINPLFLKEKGALAGDVRAII